MNKVTKLYENGLKPIYWVALKRTEQEKTYKKYKEFKHLKTPVEFSALDDEMHLSWSYDFKEIECEEDVTYFSFNFPYSYEDGLRLSESLIERV